MDPRPTLAAPDDDPYLWLEELESPRALAWVAAQNQATLKRFGDARFAADRDALAAIWDRPDNLPYVSRRGAHLYNFWTDAKNPRGLWRRTTLASFRTAAPTWEILLDVDELARAEGQDWIWHGAVTLAPAHQRALLHLSRGGSDAVELREFDLTAKAFVRDGFHLPEAKGTAEWMDQDTLLVSNNHGPGMATRASYARTVRRLRRGADFARAPVVYETTMDKMSVHAGIDRSVTPPRVWYVETPSFFERVHAVGDGDGPKVTLDLPPDIVLDAHGDWIALRRRSEWTIGATTHPADTLLAISLSRFLKGARDFTVLFTPAPRRALSGFFWAAGKLVISILDDLRPVFEIVTPGAFARETLNGLPAIGVAAVSRLDIEETEGRGELVANVQDPITPPSLMLREPGKSWEILKRAPSAFTTDGLVVTRHEAVSIDGERIPYVQVGPPGETGDAPVHLSGYGGFRISRLPVYNSAVGKLWLERGGTGVVANIRGGGEFGSRWHDAGRFAGKRLTHDDFAAVAADLVRRGVTRPARIAAEGGSNGGILITNMLTRYPERFGALFCTIPLIDMRRFPKLHSGASWIAEYGDPDKPEEWAFIKTFSAYHAAEPGHRYPPILIATTRKDDRVHPGHARKMAAKLQAMGYEAYFYEPEAGGHGYGKDNAERAAFTALGFAFLRDKIGWR